MKGINIHNRLMNITEVTELIEQGRWLVISAEESLLRTLPSGNWIGGTIPYFYLKGEKGRKDKQMLFVNDFTEMGVNFRIHSYDETSLSHVSANGFANGFHFLILPALKDIHLSFALHSLDYPNIFDNPLIGLVAGADLDEFGKGVMSKTVNGSKKEYYEDYAVVMYVELPPNKVARMEIINVFEQEKEPVINVMEDSFIVKDCLIDGVKTNLYEYIKKNHVDIRYPLTCDYAGAIVNASYQKLDDYRKEVVFYAPLFKDKQYFPAKKIDNYAEVFREKLSKLSDDKNRMVFNCNCILNYLYGDLENNDIGYSGAATFGEIAYNLLNQTFTYLVIDEQ